jgi:uncharacterized membrane protein (UPF0127 family)
MPDPKSQLLWNRTRARPIAGRLLAAQTWLERGLGLLARPPLGPGEALWIVPCGSIHTWGMRHALDVLYLDREFRVLRVQRELAPWRIGWAPRGTRSVVELPGGAGGAVREGDLLAVRPASSGARPGTGAGRPNAT